MTAGVTVSNWYMTQGRKLDALMAAAPPLRSAYHGGPCDLVDVTGGGGAPAGRPDPTRHSTQTDAAIAMDDRARTPDGLSPGALHASTSSASVESCRLPNGSDATVYESKSGGAEHTETSTGKPS